MDGRYREAIAQASSILADAMLEDADELVTYGRQLDAHVRVVVLRLGLVLVQRLLAILSRRLVQEAKEEGFAVERRPVVTFNTILGPLEVESPYMYKRECGEGRRPMRHAFGVVGRQYSDARERALTDFGIEKSFGRAAKQFAEHYGWEFGRTILRLTENLGAQAEEFVEQRLSAGERRYQAADAEAPKAERMLVALDGCMLRTGRLMTAGEAVDEAANDDERQRYQQMEPDKLVHLEQWKEVPDGPTRHPLYVCCRADHETVCRQLFGAPGLQRLGFQPQVMGLIDGAQGLKEAMALSFADVQIILDPSHLKSHCYATAVSLGMEGPAAHAWVGVHFEKLAEGKLRACSPTSRPSLASWTKTPPSTSAYNGSLSI